MRAGEKEGERERDFQQPVQKKKKKGVAKTTGRKESRELKMRRN